jgi:hypothetical protein
MVQEQSLFAAHFSGKFLCGTLANWQGHSVLACEVI